jgi:hypothetical protein
MFNRITINPTINPGESRNRWNSTMFTEIGANNSKANGTHLFNINIKPIKISSKPTTFKIYPELLRESINSAASPV